MDVVSIGVIIPITNSYSVEVSVSTSIILLRFRYPQLVPFSSLLLLINKYSNSIVIITNLYLYITVTS